jgi:hypothetical protein
LTLLAGALNSDSGSCCLHQQYLSDAKNPYGYCPDHGTGVARPVGLMRAGE